MPPQSANVSPMVQGVGQEQCLPASRGGGFGQVVSVRAMRGTEEDGQTLAEITYKKRPDRDYAAAGAAGGAAPALLGGDTITVVQALSTAALPPGSGAEPPAEAAAAPGVTGAKADDTGLSHGEQAMVGELRARDAAVRAEEESHAALAGAYAGPIQYDYAAGPDGRLYIVGGSVNVSTAGISDPEQLASALGAMRSAGSVAAATSVQDSLSASAAGRGLATVMSALAEARTTESQSAFQKSITPDSVTGAYARAAQLGRPAPFVSA